MSKRFYKSNRTAGVSLVETVIAVFFIGAAVVSICWGALEVSRIFAEESAASNMTEKSRNSLDLMRRDVICSDKILSTLTVGATTYTTSTSGVLILEVPSMTYSANGTPSGPYEDDVVYHLVGTSAPYTLNRLVHPATGSPIGAMPDNAIAKNVQSLSLTFLHHVSYLEPSTPVLDIPMDVPASSVASASNSSVNVGGTNIAFGTLGTQASFIAPGTTYTNGAVLLPSLPATGTYVDLFYPVTPSLVTGSWVGSSVLMTLSLSTPVTVPSEPSTQSITLMSEGTMRN